MTERVRRLVSWGLALGLVGLLVCGGVAAVFSDQVGAIIDAGRLAFEEPDWAEIDSSERVLEYLVAHPDNYSLVAYEVGPDGEPQELTRIAHRPDTPRVLASTMKIVVLAALARAEAAGDIDLDDEVRLGDWDSWYLAGLDGGAHPAAYNRLDIPHEEGRAKEPDAMISLSKVAFAMIRFSDNAATDVLVDRLGDHLDAAVAEVAGQEPISPIFDVMVHGLTHDDPCAAPVPPLDRRERAARIEAGVPITGISDQRTMTHCLFPRGTAEGYARLMAEVVSGQKVSADASAMMADVLDWPMEFEANREEFSTFGTKGGALPGVLTEASFMHPRDGQRWVVVLFMDDMSGSAWFALLGSFAQQEFMRKLAVDPEFRRTVARRLAAE